MSQSAPSPGGTGGGLARITATTIQLDGTISANAGGTSGSGFAPRGAGSGGGIRIDTSTLMGSGSISANGGNHTGSQSSGGGAGGGGRIAIYYENISGFSLANISARGGPASGSDVFREGGAGTIYLRDTLNQTFGTLITDNEGPTTREGSTPLRSIGRRINTSLFANELVDGGASFPVPNLAIGSLGLIGLELNPNTAQGQTFTVVDNTATRLFTDPADGDLRNVAGVGDPYSGIYTLDDLQVRGGASLGADDAIFVLGSGPTTLLIDGAIDAPQVDFGLIDTLDILDGRLDLDELIGPNLATVTVTNSTLQLDDDVEGLTSVTVDSSVVEVDGRLGSSTMIIQNGSTVRHPKTTLTTEPRLELVATNMTIDATSAINLSTFGYLTGYEGGNGGQARTLGNVVLNDSSFGTGGSYGGLGASSSSFNPPPADFAYGDFRDPDELGSGGDGFQVSQSAPVAGGSGGGRVRITTTTLQLDGSIVANGGASGGSDFAPRAAGAGGGIKIETTTLAGSGSVRANGGDHSGTQTSAGGAGGGGRIAIYYEDASGFNFANVSADAGTAGNGSNANRNGGAGTIFLQDTINEVFGTLLLDGGGPTTRPGSTPLRSIGSASSTGLAANSLTRSGAGFRVPDPAIGELGLTGLELNPNDVQGMTFTVINNTATQLFTDPADGSMTAVANLGDQFTGVYTFDDLQIRGGASLGSEDIVEVLGTNVTSALVQGAIDAPQLDLGLIDTFDVTNGRLGIGQIIGSNLADFGITNSSVVLDGDLLGLTSIIIDASTVDVDGELGATTITAQNGSVLRHPKATITSEPRFALSAGGTLTIDASTSINVSERGYLAGFMDGNGGQGRTLGNLPIGDSSFGTGGSYGGLGASSSQFNPPGADSAYGDFRNPNELGSGGDGFQVSQSAPVAGGNGGGLVRLSASTLVLDGTIVANAGASGGSNFAPRAAGAGGGVFIDTGVLTGSGSIAANGGDHSGTQTNAGGAGGGGRIAVYYEDASGFNLANLSADGGTAGNGSSADRNGGAGTIFLQNTLTQTFGSLIVDAAGTNTRVGSTPLRGIGAGVSSTVLADELFRSGAGFPVPDPVVGSIGLIGLELNPNTAQGQTFTVVDNTATRLFTDPADGDMTAVAFDADPYVGVYSFDDVSVINGAQADTTDRCEIFGTLDTTGGTLTCDNLP